MDNVVNFEDKKTVLTDSEVDKVYNELSTYDEKSKEDLNKAKEETEKSNYTEITESTPDTEIPGIGVTPESVYDLNKIEETSSDIQSILDEYGVSDDEVAEMINIIDEYKKGKTSNLYNRIPESFKKMADGLVMAENSVSISNIKELQAFRNAAAKTLIDEFIHDAKFNKAIDDYNEEMATVIKDMNTEYDSILGGAIDDTFNRIEEIRSEDPETAKRIESIKNSFDTAITFEKQLEVANTLTPKKLNKLMNRYNDEVFYFNKRVNNNNIGVKVPNINDLLPAIKLALPQYTEDDIKKFIIVIVRSIIPMDITDLATISYIYKMIQSIYTYNFINIDDKGEVIFGNISKVIEAITK